jgi:hypothetical protein
VEGWQQLLLFDEGSKAVQVLATLDCVDGKCIGWRVEARNIVDNRLLGLTYAPRRPETSGTNVQEGLAHAQAVAEVYLDPF